MRRIHKTRVSFEARAINFGSPGVNYPELFKVYHSVGILPLKGGFGVLLAA